MWNTVIWKYKRSMIHSQNTALVSLCINLIDGFYLGYLIFCITVLRGFLLVGSRLISVSLRMEIVVLSVMSQITTVLTTMKLISLHTQHGFRLWILLRSCLCDGTLYFIYFQGVLYFLCWVWWETFYSLCTLQKKFKNGSNQIILSSLTSCRYLQLWHDIFFVYQG